MATNSLAQPPISRARTIRHYNAYVRNGRLVLDEPATDLTQSIAEAIDDALEASGQLAAEMVARPASMTPLATDRI